MHCRGVAHALITLVILWTSDVGAQQRDESLGAKTRDANPATAGIRPRRQANLGTYSSNPRFSSNTRLDRLRRISPLAPRGIGLLRDPPFRGGPIKSLLDQRNYLRTRSALGASSTIALGQTPLPPRGPDDLQGNFLVGSPAESSSQPATQPTSGVRTYVDVLAARIDAKADEQFDLGAVYLRYGDFPRARHCFDVARDLRPDDPKPYLGSMVGSYCLGDYNQAIWEILRAMELAKTLDELRIEGFVDRFFPGEDAKSRHEAFERALDSVNPQGDSAGAPSPVNVLRAYYSWLNNDVSTAISAADLASQAFEGPRGDGIRRFRGWIAEEGRPAKVSGPVAR